MSVRRRIAAGVGANAFGQVITIGIQLLALPVFLHYWDAARYGTWLILSAVPSYFTLADVGMVTAAGNKMTMDIGRGDYSEANRTFQSALVFMLCTCAAVLLVSVLLLGFARLPLLADPAYRVTLGCLIAAVLLAFFNGLAEAVFRATGRYSVGTVLGQSIRLVEWAGGIAGLVIARSFVAVALGMLVGRGLGAGAVMAYAAGSTPSVRWGVSEASVDEVRAMVRPAAMFMMFPIINALSFQGFTLLVGGLFGPVYAAIFNTYRTLARIAVQATSTLSTAAGPEMSRLYGASGSKELHTLYQRANQVSACFAVGLPLLIGLLGRSLLLIWTHGRIPYDASLLWPMLIYAGLSSAWHVSRVLLQSINQHGSVAVVSLGMAVVSLGGGWAVGKWVSLAAMVWVLIVSELIMAFVAHQLAKQVLNSRTESPRTLPQMVQPT